MMYDELAAFVVEEVALDGDQGTELSRFWNFVDSYVDSKKDELAAPPSTDDQWKDHVWKMLSRMSGMTCKMIPEHRQNTAVQGGTGRKGKGRARDENVELETVDVSNMTLKDVNERFGGRLRLTADADLQRTAMFGDEDIVQLVSAQSLKVLHHVARTRSVGATQADMAKELKLDPRSLFHFVKTLVQKKLVVKLPVVTKGNYTSLVILAKCAPYNSAYAGKSVYLPSPTTGSNPSPGVSFNSHLIRFRITQLLANAKNQTLYASDLLRALGMCNPSMRQRRWFNRTLGGLQRRGYVEKLNKKAGRGYERCVKLVMMYDVNTNNSKTVTNTKALSGSSTPASSSTRTLKAKSAKSHGKLAPKSSLIHSLNQAKTKKPSDMSRSKTRISHALCDLPIDRQIYDLIHSSGEVGITAKELRDRLGSLNVRFLNKILVNLVKPQPDDLIHFTVKRVGEFQGRTRQYRYFTPDGFVKYQIAQGFDPEESEELVGSNMDKTTMFDPLINRFKVVNVKRNKPKYNRKRKMSSKLSGNDTDSASERSHKKIKIQDTDYLIEIGPPTKSQSVNNSTNITPAYKRLGKIPKIRCLNSTEELTETNNNDSATSTNECIIVEDEEVSEFRASTSRAQVVSVEQRSSAKKSATKSSSRDTGSRKQVASNTFTSRRRHKIISDLLEEHKILECNYVLIRRYQEAEASYGSSTPYPHIVCKKTLMRAGEYMEMKGLLKQYTVALPLLNGGITHKLLFLHPTLTPNSKEVKDYIAKMQDKAILAGGTYKSTPVDEVDVEVESLDEMQRRIGVNSERGDVSPRSRYDTMMFADSMDVDNAETLPSDAGENVQSTSQVKISDPGGDLWWLNIARDYGWINAKMLRAKLLHQFLIETINNASPDDNRVSKEVSVFETAILLREMPLGLYLRIIGQTNPSKELTDYINSGGDLSVRLIDVAPEIRATIFHRNYKYRFALKNLLDILAALQLISPISKLLDDEGRPLFGPLTRMWLEGADETGAPALFETSDSDVLMPAYKVMHTVPMYDYAVPGPNRPYIKDYQIVTPEDLQIYWSELQYIALQRETESNVADVDRSQDVSQDVSRDKINSKKSSKNKDPLSFITFPRNWQGSYALSIRQKKLLESYVDRTAGKTPYNDDMLCQKISKECTIPVSRVKAYYKRIEEAYYQKTQTKQQNRASIKRAPKPRRSRREGLLKQRSISGVVASAQGEPSFRRRRRTTNVHRLVRKVQRTRNNTSNNTSQTETNDELQIEAAIVDGEIVPVINDETRFETQYEQLAQRTRPNWTVEEDELLIHAYAIMKVRAAKARFLWAVINKVIPNRTKEMCRRRIAVLSKRVTMRDRINSLTIQWERIYKNAIEREEIIDENVNDLLNYDLLGQVEYFMNIMENQPSILTPVPSVYLPADVSILNEQFVVKDFSSNRRIDYYFEDQLPGKSLRQKQEILLSSQFSCQLPNDELVDFPLKCENITMDTGKMTTDMVEALLKMILLTPDDQYDTTHAFSILNYYPIDYVDKALEEAKASGAIVKVKSGFDRRVPGRGYHVSEKFLKVINGNLPERFFTHAANYHKQLVQRVMFSPFANSGTMACLLDMLANDKITLTGLLPSHLFTNLIPNYRTRQIDESKLHFDIVISPKNFDATIKTSMVSQHEFLSEPNNHQLPTIEQPKIVMLDEDTSMDTIDLEIENRQNSQEQNVFEKQDRQKEKGKKQLCHFKFPKSKKEAVSEAKKLMMTLDKETRSSAFTVFKAVARFGKLGIYLQESSEQVPDAHIGQALNLLGNHTPILTMRVGHKVNRYVCGVYAERWLVDVSNRQSYNSARYAPKTVNAAVDAGITSGQGQTPRERTEPEKKFALPRMWYNINGEFIESVHRGCLEVVLGTILKKPGIYESNIYRKLRLVMTHAEIQDILEDLVERGCVTRRCFLKPQKATLFSAPRTFEDCDYNVISSDKVSCYWVNQGYYLYHDKVKNCFV